MSGDTNARTSRGEKILNLSGGKTDRGISAAQAEQGYKNYDALVAASQDPNIDTITRAELAQAVKDSSQYELTPGALALVSNLGQIKSGEGIFGIRRKNEELAKLLLEKPGSKQTLLSINTPNQPGSVTQTNLLGG